MDCGAQLLNAAINLSFCDQNFSLDHRNGDGEKRFATVVAHKIFLWHELGAFDKNTLGVARAGRIAFRGVRDRASGMMKGAAEPHLASITLRLGEDVVPEAKTHHYFQGHRDVSFRL